MLRQWLNEDRIGRDEKMVTSSEIEFWLTGDESLLSASVTKE